MRILGADSFIPEMPFTGTSISEIPSNYLMDNDLCVVKIKNKSTGSVIVYYYSLDADSGLEESIPNVIKPLDSLDNKRWVLSSSRVKQIIAGEVQSDVFNPHPDGDDTMLFHGDTLTLEDEMCTINGQLTVTTSGVNPSGSYPPIIVDSTEMVENLNSDTVDGYHANDFVLNNHRTIQIPYTATDLFVTFYEPLLSSNYTVWVSITNLIDTDPSIYGIIVQEQTTEGFSVKFSGAIDSVNYILNYLLIGEVDT